MSFTGLSSDEEGSIVYDGEKFIVNVPVGHEQLEHFKPDGKIPVEYTHPSHAEDRRQSTVTSQPGTDSSSRSESDTGRDGSEDKEKSEESASKASNRFLVFRRISSGNPTSAKQKYLRFVVVCANRIRKS